MHNTSPDAWLERGRALVLRGDVEAALATFAAACAEHPESNELGLALAGVEWQAKRPVEAEARLRRILERDPGNTAATFLLAKILREQARMLGVETAVRRWFAQARPPVGELIQAIELLDDCGRKQAAFDLLETAIAAGSEDARLHAYAGMLGMQIGEFQRARERYAFALAHDARALDWQSAYGYAVSKRYENADDADFPMLRALLQRPALSEPARASVLFALGKAYDDVGNVVEAVACLREANGLIARSVGWSRKNWRRVVAARMDAKPLAPLATSEDFVPIFIIGLPRSGTTLVADRLARHAGVCNRGELGWIAHLAQEVARAARPSDALARAAITYRAQLRQDDSDARWFIDKQPLNFLHLDLIAALFPNARIVHCRRNSRDTALSIWSQHFAGREQDFAYDFAHIATVAQDGERLLAAAHKRHPTMIRSLRYEAFVQNPHDEARALAEWIGLPALEPHASRDTQRTISTASAWQARQPVHTRSIGRWRSYAPHLPELLQFPDD